MRRPRRLISDEGLTGSWTRPDTLCRLNKFDVRFQVGPA